MKKLFVLILALLMLCACAVSDEPVEIEPQKLFAPERKGFVAVEWGGAEVG